MRPFFCLALLFVGVISLPAPCVSGNRWMMERNRNELIMLNSRALKTVNQINRNGKVTLQGSVVYGNGDLILQLHILQHFKNFKTVPEELEKVKLLQEGPNQQIFLREEVLHEIPVVTEVSPKP